MVAKVFISGFVQGVGFRHFVRKNARDLKLMGWVKNLPDSRVEALFLGGKESIDKMIELCKKGSFVSEVESVEVEWIDEKGHFDDFNIIS
jgi:acylphosphatase